jgi:hypothetical protein
MSIALMGFERRWARAAFETIFPGPERGTLPLGIGDMDLDGFLDETLKSVPFEPAVGLRLAIWILALAPLFVLGRLATLASLSFEDRERVVARIAASPIYPVRSMVVMMKAIGALLYCGDPRVRPLMMGHGAASGAPVPLRLRAASSAASGAEHERHARIA